MKVLHVGIFCDHVLGGDIVLSEGFRANSIIPQEFDYRQIADRVGVAEMNTRLVDAARGCDLIFIGKGELVSTMSLAAIRQAGSSVTIWYGDLWPEPEPWLVDNLGECDTFFMTTAGETLEGLWRKSRPGRAAFFLNPVNPGLAARFQHVQRSIDPPLFSGTPCSFACEERKAVYRYLCRRRDVQILGSPARCLRNHLLQRLYLHFRPTRYLRGSEYIEKIIRARFGIGVSAFQNQKYYTSDRLAHYLTFGKLYLAHWFPGCEDLFRDGGHLVFFKGIDDLDSKIEFYLRNREIAEKIGRNGQRKMAGEYNAKNMVRMMLDIIDTGQSDMYPWVEVYS